MMTSKDAMLTWSKLTTPNVKSCTNCAHASSIECDDVKTCSAPHRLRILKDDANYNLTGPNNWKWNGCEIASYIDVSQNSALMKACTWNIGDTE